MTPAGFAGDIFLFTDRDKGLKVVPAFLADELVNRHGTPILSDLKTRDNQKEVIEKS